MTTRTKWLRTASLLALVAGGWAFWRWEHFPQPNLLGTYHAGSQTDETIMTFAPQKSILAVNGGTGRLIDLETGSQRFLRSNGTACSVLFRAGGDTIVTVCGNGLVQLWDAQHFSELSRFDALGSYSVNWAAISPDGNQILCNGKNLDEVAVWDLDSGELVTTFAGPGTDALEGIFSPDGRFVATFGNRFTKLWTPPEFKEHVTLDKCGRSVAFCPDGKTLATCGWEGIRLWEVSSGSLLKTLSGRVPVNHLAFSPDGRTLATGCGSPSIFFSHGPAVVELWDLRSEKVVGRWTAWKNTWVMGVAFSPDGTKLATTEYGGEAKVWGIENVVRMEKVPVPSRE